MGLSPEDGRGERRADDRSQRHAVRRCRGGRGLGLVPVPLWLTNDQPTELDKEVPICARPPTRALPRTSWFPTWTAPPASPPRALPRTSWLSRAASSPEVPPGRHDRGADAMRTVPRDGGPGSRRFWRPPHKQMSHDRSRGTPGRTVGQVVGNDPAPSSDI